MPTAVLATEMLMVLWKLGTCLHIVKLYAVAPPLCRLNRKTLPGSDTLLSLLIAGGGALRLMTPTKLHDRFFHASSGTRSVFGWWAACVNASIEVKDHARVVGDLPPFSPPPAGNDHKYVIHDYNLSQHIVAPCPAANPSCAFLQWPRNMAGGRAVFDLLAEHRGSVHGTATTFHGHVHGVPRTTADIPPATADLPRAFSDIPSDSTECYGK